jgi:predicted Zn finger-like uncharacterized protein
VSLVTQCPKCGTRFRVTPEQLEARQGKVRCGLCLNVFDGREPLVTAPDAAPAKAAGQDAGAFRLEPVEPGAGAPEPAALESALEERDYGPAPEQLSFDDQVWIEEEHARRRRAAVWWSLGAMALFVVLGVHAAYVFRSELAARFPALKPQLVRLCGPLRCTVMPPQRPQLIAIEASDLQFKDSKQPSLIQLTATLRNRAGYDVGYPALDLVLTNQLEHTLARRIFLPAEYLGSGRDPVAGIAANAEFTVRLDLDAGALNPAGYRLNLLDAP